MAPQGFQGYPAHMQQQPQQQTVQVEYAHAPLSAGLPAASHHYGASHGAYAYAGDDAYTTMVGYNGMQVHHIGEVGKDGRPKRRQVKNACTNCQKACKKCDEGRPCSRCVKYGLTDTCENSVRKERKRGIKRGPYKRRNKTLSAVLGSSIMPNGLPFAIAHRAGAAASGASLPPNAVFTTTGVPTTVVSAPNTVQRSPIPLDVQPGVSATYHHGAMTAPVNSPYMRAKPEVTGYASTSPIGRPMYNPNTTYISHSTPVSVAGTPISATFAGAQQQQQQQHLAHLQQQQGGNGMYAMSRVAHSPASSVASLQPMMTSAYSSSSVSSSSPVPSLMGHQRLHSDSGSSFPTASSMSSNGSVYSPRTPMSATGGLPSMVASGYGSTTYVTQGTPVIAHQQQHQQGIEGKPFMLKLPPAPRNRALARQEEQMPSAEEFANSRPPFLNLPQHAHTVPIPTHSTKWSPYSSYSARFEDVSMGMKTNFSALPPLQS